MSTTTVSTKRAYVRPRTSVIELEAESFVLQASARSVEVRSGSIASEDDVLKPSDRRSAWDDFETIR